MKLHSSMMRNLHCAAVAATIALTGLFGAGAAIADETPTISNHEGYYYPSPVTQEIYKARAEILAGSDRRRRISFVTQFMAQMAGQAGDPGYVLFAKGDEADKYILTATGSHRYNTMFRMRALLALMTAQARGSELFRDAKVDDIFTFLDLLKLIGVRQLTVTDGDTFTHQFKIK